ncbi:hypothetical protein XOCgx_1273 [Xanthomonas oryzae pv. oryzicola]|nr:hypothetical protein XOCgx_1273 [Xanthomonas oryzae pv. oryzicola]
MSIPLFAQVLGPEAFAQLPAPVRALHSVQQRQTFAGRATDPAWWTCVGAVAGPAEPPAA